MSCLKNRKFWFCEGKSAVKINYGKFLHLNRNSSCKNWTSYQWFQGLAKLLEVCQRTFTFQLGQNDQQINMAGVTAADSSLTDSSLLPTLSKSLRIAWNISSHYEDLLFWHIGEPLLSSQKLCVIGYFNFASSLLDRL